MALPDADADAPTSRGLAAGGKGGDQRGHAARPPCASQRPLPPGCKASSSAADRPTRASCRPSGRSVRRRFWGGGSDGRAAGPGQQRRLVKLLVSRGPASAGLQREQISHQRTSGERRVGGREGVRGRAEACSVAAGPCSRVVSHARRAAFLQAASARTLRPSFGRALAPDAAGPLHRARVISGSPSERRNMCEQEDGQQGGTASRPPSEQQQGTATRPERRR